MPTYLCSDPVPAVADRLRKAGEEFWNDIDVNAGDGQLSIERTTFWKGGPLWRFQGRLESDGLHGTATRLRGDLRCSYLSLYLPYLMVVAMLAMVDYRTPGPSVFLRGLLPLCALLTPFVGLRWLTGLGERQGILRVLEQAGLHERGTMG